MDLKKTNENILRSYDAEGNATERTDNANYQIIDTDGNVIGSANISQGYANVNLNISGFNGIDQGEQQIRAILAIPDPE